MKSGMFHGRRLVLLGVLMLPVVIGGEYRPAARLEAGAPVMTGNGGVLVPKRVRLIIGFVQTLPV